VSSTRRDVLTNLGSQTGDRDAFLGRLRRRLASSTPANAVHPIPALTGALPRPRPHTLDEDDLVTTFVRAAESAGSIVAVVPTFRDAADHVHSLLRRWPAPRVATSRDPEVDDITPILRDAGAESVAREPDSLATAHVGFTGARWAIASTGSTVHDAGRAGGRAVGLLPGVHVALVCASVIVPTPSDVLRRLGHEAIPSNLVIATGPSRSADIEHILTVGVHGPVEVHVILQTGVGSVRPPVTAR
jgi:L-lactate dehydrogenase complex protein LldG